MCSTGLKAKCHVQHSVAQRRPAATRADCSVDHRPCAVTSWLGSLQYAAVQTGQPALFLPAAKEGYISLLSNGCCACKRAGGLMICSDSSIRARFFCLYEHCCMEFAYWTSSFWTSFSYRWWVSFSKEYRAPEVVCCLVPFNYRDPVLLAFSISIVENRILKSTICWLKCTEESLKQEIKHLFVNQNDDAESNLPRKAAVSNLIY